MGPKTLPSHTPTPSSTEQFLFIESKHIKIRSIYLEPYPSPQNLDQRMLNSELSGAYLGLVLGGRIILDPMVKRDPTGSIRARLRAACFSDLMYV